MITCVSLLSNGWKGFDTNQVVTRHQAETLRSSGYRFVLRYVPRDHHRAGDLTPEELKDLYSAGLMVMPVQHVAAGRWMPSTDLGTSYGQMAARTATALEIPRGVNVWLDLEAVDDAALKTDIIGYCKAWFDAVAAAGFKPGVYVGWEAGLGPESLYYDLPFHSYWSAYNLNRDQYPAKRSVMLQQLSGGRIAGVSLQADIVHSDALGDLPLAAAPVSVLSE